MGPATTAATLPDGTMMHSVIKRLQKLSQQAQGHLRNLSLFKKREPSVEVKRAVDGPSFADPLQLAKDLNLPVLDEIPLGYLSKEKLKELSYGFVKKNLVLPFKEEKGELLTAVCDPLAIEPLEELRILFNQPIRAYYAPAELLSQTINLFYEKEEGAASELLANLKDRSNRDDSEIEVYDLLDDAGDQAPIIKLLNLILIEAIQQGASDVHFDPTDAGLKVRYRIDGVLHSRHSPALDFQAQLITRLKVMAKLDIAEHRLPQDGRIKLRIGRKEIDFRVSTLPVANGERIVLRILDKGNVILGINRLGMLKETEEEFIRLINIPEGIVLVTGPTGSGKTTSLYSALAHLNEDSVNIMTIEDPVEYQLKGIAQIAVHHKINLDFATGLRHILRQDPDVIMVGEIRDKETAEIAVQASLTGHLVLSTLHTNDAPSAITRLVDMGIEPYLLSSSIVGVLAQRLVRRICPACKKSYKPTQNELQQIGLPKETKTLFHGEGCQECYNSGYKGRHGIYELMSVNAALQKQIVSSSDAVAMRRIAMKQGMKTLRDHGQELIVQGITTITEVLRITKEIEEEI